MKKLIAAAALILMLPKAYAALPIDIEVNGNYIKTDVSPVNADGTVLVPVRAAANALGCDDVVWDGENQTVTLDGGRVMFGIGDNFAYSDGKKTELPTAARVIDSRAMIPIRFFAESFGADVTWKGEMQTVVISLDGHEVESEYVNYTNDDLEWLSKIVNAEAEGESMAGKKGVANVVLNRVDSEEFPDDIYNVIFDKKYGVQFTPVANGRIYNEPGTDSRIAAKSALNGDKNVGESLYFCNPIISTNTWIMKNREYYMTIGKHDFYL